MLLQRYKILQVSARTLLACAGKTADGYRFYFDTEAVSNSHAMKETLQSDCGMFRQLLLAIHGTEPSNLSPVCDELFQALIYLDFSGVFDRRPVGWAKELQDRAEWLFRPEGIEVDFGRGPVRFVAFERSGNMSRQNKLSFLCADLFEPMWERMTLGMELHQCQLSKLYAYNGLLFSDGRRIEAGKYNGFRMDADHIIVVANPRSLVKNVSIVTVKDDGTDLPVRRYSRVEQLADVEVLEYDGEGLVSKRLGDDLAPDGRSEHYSFQIRLPYIKGVVHTVDFHALFAELGVMEIEDVFRVRHPVEDVDMILTQSMFKGLGWMRENNLSWEEYLERCKHYGHSLFVTGMDHRNRDGLTELNYQLLNTAAITAEEYRPSELSFGWAASPEEAAQSWLTKGTETAYYNAVANEAWQLSYLQDELRSRNPVFGDPNLARGELLCKNPAFLKERVFQRELEKRAEAIRDDFAIGTLMVSGDARYLSDDLMRLLAELARPVSEAAYQALLKECLSGAVVYVPQPSYPLQEQLTILRNPHISRNEEVLATPLVEVGPLREKYLSHLYYVVMVDSRSLIPDRLGGADYDGDTVHVYAEPLLNQCIRRNYQGGFENENNLPLLKIPAAEPLLADARDWQARFQAVKSTFSSRIGQISNAALRRSILAYDEHTPVQDRERYRKETEILTILTGLEIDSAKSGVKPELSEYLQDQSEIRSGFLEYKRIAGESEAHKWYEPSRATRMKKYFQLRDLEEITANLERTPWYARELGKQTKRPKAVPARSEELFTFAIEPGWENTIDPKTLEKVKAIIADYEEAVRRCEEYRHIKPSENCRKDIRRILFSRNQEDEITVDQLFRDFDRYVPYVIRDALARLRESSWQFTPPEDRMAALWEIMGGSPPYKYAELLCDFRCGGYRILGDILEDLELQYRKQGIKDQSGMKNADSRFLKTILRGVFDAADYREQLRNNCFRAILPTRLHFIGADPAEENEYRFPADEIVKCAELLGKRDFILEVLPGVARELAIDRTAKPEIKKKRWWQRVKRA